VDPARRQSHTRDSCSNCGSGERDMVLTLTPEHLAVGNDLIFDRFNQARGRSKAPRPFQGLSIDPRGPAIESTPPFERNLLYAHQPRDRGYLPSKISEKA
jgi:hypothetical protein